MVPKGHYGWASFRTGQDCGGSTGALVQQKNREQIVCRWDRKRLREHDLFLLPCILDPRFKKIEWHGTELKEMAEASLRKYLPKRDLSTLLEWKEISATTKDTVASEIERYLAAPT